jgi:aminopeptidase YwaD
MKDEFALSRIIKYLNYFCSGVGERSVGSEGNRQATRFFRNELYSFGWDAEVSCFSAMDWEENGAVLTYAGKNFSVMVSPYSNGFSGEAEMVMASTVEELESVDSKDRFIFLHGTIAREQLMPKNFVFYNPPEHQRIIALLEKGNPKAIICATGRNAALAGGVYPFPLIEDGDFDIPSVYMTEEEGLHLLPYAGERFFLVSHSYRIPGKGYNVTGRIGKSEGRRIVVTAHIDAKKGTPGAIDNATGVIVLLLLADLLKDYDGDRVIELVAFNGEDYYAVPGQMDFIMANQGKFEEMILNINIDGAGYAKGNSAFSFYELPVDIERIAREVIEKRPGIMEGPQWPQGDHSIFIQSGVPAIAVSSEWFTSNIADQDITHTPKDNPSIVDPAKLPEIADAIAEIIRKL